MNTKITAKNVIITPGITNRITKKTEKLYRYFDQDIVIQVHINKIGAKNKKVEVTIPLKGTILRAESIGDDNLFIAIDSALSKIERQIHKHKTKLSKFIKQDNSIFEEFEFFDSLLDEEEKNVEKRKTYPVRPMSLEDAKLNMEMLGHSFYIYIDADTNLTNVLYLRKDGTLGLLEPER